MDTDVEHVMDLVDELGQPSLMTKEQFVEFLEGIINACEARATATREELAR
jgi:hypothetical protein